MVSPRRSGRARRRRHRRPPARPPRRADQTATLVAWSPRPEPLLGGVSNQRPPRRRVAPVVTTERPVRPLAPKIAMRCTASLTRLGDTGVVGSWPGRHLHVPHDLRRTNAHEQLARHAVRRRTPRRGRRPCTGRRSSPPDQRPPRHRRVGDSLDRDERDGRWSSWTQSDRRGSRVSTCLHAFVPGGERPRRHRDRSIPASRAAPVGQHGRAHRRPRLGEHESFRIAFELAHLASLARHGEPSVRHQTHWNSQNPSTAKNRRLNISGASSLR